MVERTFVLDLATYFDQQGKNSSDLESSGAPVNELYGPPALDGRDGCIHVFGHNVPTVEQAARHVLAVARVALHHLVSRLEARVGDLGHGELLVVGLLSRDHGSIGHQGKVDPATKIV